MTAGEDDRVYTMSQSSGGSFLNGNIVNVCDCRKVAERTFSRVAHAALIETVAHGMLQVV